MGLRLREGEASNLKHQHCVPPAKDVDMFGCFRLHSMEASRRLGSPLSQLLAAISGY